jgi:hypothetical protein
MGLAGVEGLRVTTSLLWRATIVLSLVAAALLPLVVRMVPRERFATLKTHVVGATFLVWLVLWSVMVVAYWQSVYSYFFPAWLRWPLPLLMATGFAAASWPLWHLARRFQRWPALAFVLLGAMLGPLTHTWAVLRGIVTKPPLLQGASPVAAVSISAPEFAIYFTIILCLAALSRSTSDRYGRRSYRKQARTS